MNAMVDNMKALATLWHGKDTEPRKDSNKPAITHPARVVAMLEKWGVTDPRILCIGWGHDLLEDTTVEPSEIVKASEQFVLDCVMCLTFMRFGEPDPYTPDEYKAAKKAYVAKVAETAPVEALVVKLADRLSNTLEFLENGHHHKPIKYFKKGKDLFDAVSRIDQPLRDAIIAEIEATKKAIGWKD